LGKIQKEGLGKREGEKRREGKGNEERKTQFYTSRERAKKRGGGKKGKATVKLVIRRGDQREKKEAQRKSDK